MKYDRIDRNLFIDNRKRFRQHLKPGSMAIFTSNDIVTTSADSTMPFKQHRDIFHLSGIDQEESVLVIFPDCSEEKNRELLFLKKTSKEIAIWEGEKYTKEAAFETSGIKTVYWNGQFNSILLKLMSEAAHVYLNSNEHLRANTEGESREDRLRKWIMNEFPLHEYERSAPIMHSIRSVKHAIEIDLMQTACDITKKGVDRVLKFIRPGVMEYQIEAELVHEFLNNRSQGFAYTPIVASGANACVLHYIENNKECFDGDVILMDVGAEYANYASDLTRSIPVSGRFTDRQRKVYDAVLRVKNGATDLLRPGITLPDYHKEVGLMMEKELIGLGLITQHDVDKQNKDWPAYKKYFMHGTSHYIGLDTHDVGSWNEPIKANMAFTVEPGIYIQEEGLGIRLEDDVIVQENGSPRNLMGHIAIEAEAIEEMMNS